MTQLFFILLLCPTELPVPKLHHSSRCCSSFLSHPCYSGQEGGAGKKVCTHFSSRTNSRSCFCLYPIGQQAGAQTCSLYWGRGVHIPLKIGNFLSKREGKDRYLQQLAGSRGVPPQSYQRLCWPPGRAELCVDSLAFGVLLMILEDHPTSPYFGLDSQGQCAPCEKGLLALLESPRRPNQVTSPPPEAPRGKNDSSFCFVPPFLFDLVVL